VAEDVCVAVVCSNAKVRIIRSIPLIFDGFDKQSDITEPELDRALVGFVTRVAFDLDFHHFDEEYHITRDHIPRHLAAAPFIFPEDRTKTWCGASIRLHGMIAVNGPTQNESVIL